MFDENHLEKFNEYKKPIIILNQKCNFQQR